MSLSQHNALKIVSKINQITNLNMNIINSHGVIIASTDRSRIGTFHEGAKKIIENNLEELFISSDNEYCGARAGINYPLIVRNQIIGVIGVTGDDETTLSYAKIIKEMTEILVLETIIKEEQEINESMRNRFLDEWLNGNGKNITNEFVERGKFLGIDITIPRRIIVISVIDNKERCISNFSETDKALKYMKKLISYGSLNFFLTIASYLIVGLPVQNDNDILKILSEYKNIIETKFTVSVVIGIDSKGEENHTGNYLMTFQSYLRAKKAHNTCLHSKRDILFYDDVNIEIFTNELPDILKIEYINKIFKDMNRNEMTKVIELLEVYYDEEGSVRKAADRLFIHKNTLQYKLRKIKDVTGYDPRSIRESSLFFIAIQFYNEIYELLLLSN